MYASTRCRARARALGTLSLGLSLHLVLPQASFAEPDSPPAEKSTSEPPDGYMEAVVAALDEYGRGNYEEAHAHFLRAHGLSPSARTLRGLGKVEFELRNYGDAVRHLEQALASDVKPLDPALREETEKLLARARVYVGEVHVQVEPGSATVSVDGVTVASGPRASLMLQVGDHVLEFRAQGRVSERRAIRVEGGAERVVQVVLPAFETAPAATTFSEARSTSHRDAAPALRRRRWIWTTVGLGAAVAASAVAVVVSRPRGSSREGEGVVTSATLPGAVVHALGAAR